MNYPLPHTIENCIGEKLIFKEIIQEEDGDRLLVENYVESGSGPVMHTHWLQDEALTVVEGKLGYQVEGQPKKYAFEGETVLFEKGTPHRFWNDGADVLHCKGWLKPANTIIFFLSSIYAAQNKSGNAQPERFDAAYLMTRYSAEYDLPGIPAFVKKTIIPVIYTIGKLLGKYSHFKDAPEPIKNLHASK
jgi:quercetin dioxygenase-like cupin family protein